MEQREQNHAPSAQIRDRRGVSPVVNFGPLNVRRRGAGKSTRKIRHVPASFSTGSRSSRSG